MVQKRAWLIQGYDGVTLLFKRKISSALSESEVTTLLKRLAARDLNVNEVLAASLRKSMKGYFPGLHVTQEAQPQVILSCGSNPHYVASRHTELEFQDMELMDADRT